MSQVRPAWVSPVTQNFITWPAEARTAPDDDVAVPAAPVVAVLVERSFVPTYHRPVTVAPEIALPAPSRTVTTAVPVAYDDELRIPVTVSPATSSAGGAETVTVTVAFAVAPAGSVTVRVAV